MEKNQEKKGVIFMIIVSLIVGVVAGFTWGSLAYIIAKNFFGQSWEYWSVFRWVGGLFFAIIFIGWGIKDFFKPNK